MIETQRTSLTRILKNRDVLAANTVLPAGLESDGAFARASAVEPDAPSRCASKEARLTTVEGGGHAVEVRCSCGEWTRVELQVGSEIEVAR